MTATRVGDSPSNGQRPPRDNRRWPSLEADLKQLSPSAPTRPARVAITSYEFNGIVRNGGIGTACTSLAKALAAVGHEVDLFFTGWADDPSEEAFERWKAHYARLGARLHWLDLGDLPVRLDAPVFSAAHSYALYEQLRERDEQDPYDVIHFVESIGHGFYSLLAKRQGLAFRNSTTVVGVHSPRRWMAEAHGLPFDAIEDLGDEELERRSIELADVLVSPSAHMLDWLAGRGIRLPARSYVQQYITTFDSEQQARTNPNGPPTDELVFFGRLEPRKGLSVFCEALELLAERPHGELRKVTFLGRHSPIDGVHSSDYIAARAESWPWDHEVLSDFDRDRALQYLREDGRLAVMASPIDNSPNTVYEALGLGINFLASHGGGIGELVHPDDRGDFTYDPRDPLSEEIDPGDLRRTRRQHRGTTLAERLEQVLQMAPRRARFSVDPKANREVHLGWHRAVARSDRRGSPDDELRAPEADGGPPLVTIEVGEVEQVGLPADRSDGLVLVVDPAAERDPRLASALIAAAERSPEIGFFTSLGRFEIDGPDGPITRCFLPTGGPGTFGVAGNCFGAGAFLARRSALERLGAIGGGDRASGADAVPGLLALAALAGEQIQVVPEALYQLPSSSIHWDSASTWANPLEALRPYHLALQSEAAEIASVAWRLSRERHYLRARAEAAEREKDDAAQRLAVVTGSRSWRLTSWLRRLALAVRRPLKSRET